MSDEGRRGPREGISHGDKAQERGGKCRKMEKMAERRRLR